MRNEKRMLAKIKESKDLDWLRATAQDIHRASDVAAFSDCTREWNKLCEMEHECKKRISDIEKERSTEYVEKEN